MTLREFIHEAQTYVVFPETGATILDEYGDKPIYWSQIQTLKVKPFRGCRDLYQGRGHALFDPLPDELYTGPDYQGLLTGGGGKIGHGEDGNIVIMEA